MIAPLYKAQCLYRGKDKDELIQNLHTMDSDELKDMVNFNKTILEDYKALKSTQIALQSDYEKISKKYDDLLKLIKHQGLSLHKPFMSNPRRNKIASSQGWKCLECHNMLGASFDIDHKVRWEDSYDDSYENLRALCVDCHRIKTATENQKKVKSI